MEGKKKKRTKDGDGHVDELNKRNNKDTTAASHVHSQRARSRASSVSDLEM